MANTSELNGDVTLLELLLEPKREQAQPSEHALPAQLIWLVLNEGIRPAAQSVEGAMGGEDRLPVAYYLAASQPNPFGTSTRVSYGLPKASDVQLVVCDVAGRRVRTLVSAGQAPGRYTTIWDGRDDKGGQAANGAYFVRIRAGRYSFFRKVTLLHR